MGYPCFNGWIMSGPMQSFSRLPVIVVKIYKVKALCNFIPPCAKPLRLTVLSKKIVVKKRL
jgi:hypothetical protein